VTVQAQTAGPTKGILRRGLPVVWGYVRLQPITYAISLTGATLYAGSVVLTTRVLGTATNEVITPAFGATGITADQARSAGLALLMLGILRGLSILLRRYLAALTTFRTQARLRRRVTGHYLDVPLRFHRDHPTGELLAHADADVLAATEVLNPLPFSVGVLVLVVFAVGSLAMVDPVLTGIALLLFPSLALINRFYLARIEVPVREVQERVGDVSALAHESFDGALVVKTLGLAEHEVGRMGGAADRLRHARVRVGRVRGFFEPAIDALPNLGQVLLLLVGAWRVSTGELTTGDLVQAVALFGVLAFPMRVMGFFLQEVPRAVVASDRLQAVLEGGSVDDSDVSGRPPIVPSVFSDLPEGPLGVRVHDLRFSFDGVTPVLDGVSFDVPAGSVVALVGATGGGKSTICELLVGLISPNSGGIEVGGVDIALVDRLVLRQAVSLVFQETFLFADSLEMNIGLDGPLSAAGGEVVAAATIAQAHPFVAELPDGYRTVVGERGITLSGGQRQRIALARALARLPRVLVLDDATSAVDPVVEAEILSALRSGSATTTLVVAHRLSTILMADTVVFLEGGKVAGTGRHNDLLRIPGYARIVHAYDEGVP